ncbi:MAG TPA: PD-(D/E)XK nuclease family protein, partial [Nocardioidaceae bacterium]|nr:PD-(D/E)XK nuclease family protein [Nocardioidaceae bacterium]
MTSETVPVASLATTPAAGAHDRRGVLEGIERTEVDGVDVIGSLSPSRAGDFMACPLLFRYRTVDRLPEPSSPDAVRGTVVHKVLEDLFDLPSAERTPARAADLLLPAWEQILEAEPAIAEMFGSEGPEVGAWLASCQESLARYFALEDPTR